MTKTEVHRLGAEVPALPDEKGRTELSLLELVEDEDEGDQGLARLTHKSCDFCSMFWGF